MNTPVQAPSQGGGLGDKFPPPLDGKFSSKYYCVYKIPVVAFIFE